MSIPVISMIHKKAEEKRKITMMMISWRKGKEKGAGARKTMTMKEKMRIVR
jgi:hypothetical protein